MNEQIWQDLKFQQDCSRDQGGITWPVERSERDWAELAKEFDKYIKETK